MANTILTSASYTATYVSLHWVVIKQKTKHITSIFILSALLTTQEKSFVGWVDERNPTCKNNRPRMPRLPFLFLIICVFLSAYQRDFFKRRILFGFVRLGICMYRLLSYPNAFIGYPETRPS